MRGGVERRCTFQVAEKEEVTLMLKSEGSNIAALNGTDKGMVGTEA